MNFSILDLLQPPFALGLIVENIPAVALDHLPDRRAPLDTRLPDHIHRLLEAVTVTDLHTASGESGVVYSGNAVLDLVKASPDNTFVLNRIPRINLFKGIYLEPGDFSMQFRLTYARRGSRAIHSAIVSRAAQLTGNAQTDLRDLQNTLDNFGAVGENAEPSDFPTKDFRLEILFNNLILYFPRHILVPAKLTDAGWLEPDTAFKEDVSIALGKVALVLEQGADNFDEINVRFQAWGVNILDDPNDGAAGEVIRMNPSLVLLPSGKFGFGIEKVVLDLSNEFTPVEILEKNFGTGDDFTGLWIPQLRFFFALSGKDGYAFDLYGKDLLFDFSRGFSGEVGLEIVNGNSDRRLEVRPVFFQNVKDDKDKIETKRVEVTRQEFDKSNPQVTTAKSTVTTAANAELQIDIHNGDPLYEISVKVNNQEVQAQDFKDSKGKVYPNRKTWPLPEGLTAGQKIAIIVEVEDNADSSDVENRHTWTEIVEATLIDPVRVGETEHIPQAVRAENVAMPAGYSLRMMDSQPEEGFVWLQMEPPLGKVQFGAGTFPVSDDGRFRVPAPGAGSAGNGTITWEPTETHRWNESFISTQPADVRDVQQVNGYENVLITRTQADEPKGDEDIKKTGRRINGEQGDAIREFIQRANGAAIQIMGYASFEDDRPDRSADYNQKLSLRRAKALAHAFSLQNDDIRPHVSGMGAGVAQGDELSDDFDSTYHFAVARFNSPAAPQPQTGTFTLRRPPDDAHVPDLAEVNVPKPVTPKRPTIFRRASVAVRIQNNELVFTDLYGELDVARTVDDGGEIVKVNYSRNDTPADGEKLSDNIETSPGASETADRGIVDFSLRNAFDTGTFRLRQTLELGFDRNKTRYGILTFKKPEKLLPLYNTFTSLLLFAPLLGEGVEGVSSPDDEDDRVKNTAIAGAQLGIATALGLTVIKGQAITLFGGTLSVEETAADFWLWNAESLNEIGIVFDYGVEFRLDLNIRDFIVIRTVEKITEGVGEDAVTKSLQPPRARYRAIGFRLNFETGTKYIPIFDTSKGYELSLGDPGALEILVGGYNVGKLLRVEALRVAKQNPLRIELDLALNINLGIITVETLRIIGIIRNESGDDPSVDFSIYPTAIGIDIPGALNGRGYLNLGRPGDVNPVEGSSEGFGGFLDLTVVPIKLRIAAGVGVGEAADPVSGRSATAIFIALEAEFPSAIPLGGSGLGIYGLLGLFAMHYQRTENPALDLPALAWFDEVVHGNVLDIQGWQPALDRWSFGVGAILGTMEGGFALNLKGMFMLELPGPRILIFVKAQILKVIPEEVKNEENAETAGILAVMDLDFNLGRLTIGLTFEYDIEKILSLRIPIESRFSFDNPDNWHLFIGKQSAPATAEILEIAKGYAFIMISGNGLTLNKKTGGTLQLQGFSLGFGFGASLILGDQDSGLYLEVGGDLLAAIGFAPFHIYGYLELRGQLHLWFVTVSAWASLEVEAVPTAPGSSSMTVRIHGEACGKVSFFFFDVEGCVEINIGPDELPPLPPPDLITGLTLVSRSSALIQNQGTDRPIDGAYGKAMQVGVDALPADGLLKVPIDSILALNLFAPPLLPDSNPGIFDLPGIAPNQRPGGWIGLGGDISVQYNIINITLNHPLLDTNQGIPANWWPRVTDDSGQISAADLALLSWVPNPTPHAFQRSIELTETVNNTWSRTCQQVAPPASVFWTFAGQPVGFSAVGWHLTGDAFPDPPDTFRSVPPDVHLFVKQLPAVSTDPMLNVYRQILKKTWLEDARVIGDELFQGQVSTNETRRALQFPLEHFDPSFEPSPNDPALPGDIKELLKLERPESILLETGAIAGANIWVSFRHRAGMKILVIRTYDRDFKLLSSKEAYLYPHTPINQFTDFPDTWENPNAPWAAKAKAAYEYQMDISSTFELRSNQYVIAFTSASDKIHWVELVIIEDGEKSVTPQPAVMLCGLELLRLAESERANHDESVRSTLEEAVDTALAGDKLRALLQPGKQYELAVNYTYTQKRGDDMLNENPIQKTQRFQFQTDQKAPNRIDPWVLATTPEADCPHHFVNDALEIIFNDASAVQLFEAYGLNLKAVVLKANGRHPEQDNDVMNLTPTNLSPLSASILSAFGHTIREVAAEIMPCIDGNGEGESHQIWTLPVPLQRHTAYVVEVVPKDPLPIPPGGSAPEAYYRFAFTTSRFLSPEELADAVAGSLIQTRLLPRPLADLPVEVSDNELQQALSDAGLEIIPPAGQPGATFLWVDTDNGFELRALLLDAPESLWRKRPLPVEETLDSENGTMTHWVMRQRLYLDVAESTETSAIAAIARTMGGTRTLIFFKTEGRSERLKLQLRRRPVKIKPADFNEAGNLEIFTLLDLALPTRPPWADES